jgi:hypothetical protein
MTLTPTLTKADRKALAALPFGRCCRRRDVVRAVDPPPWYGTPKSRGRRMERQMADVRLTLRGLEHLGYVEHHNGWWRRTAAGQHLLEGDLA